jgi:leucyl/phenylalanyl-tRNA--protein transferase
MPRLTLLRSDDPPEDFPDPEQALDDPNGLLALGGDLSPPRLLAAYRRGIFPWYEEGQPIMWWSPDPRAVLLPGELHVSRSLHRTLRSGRFTVSTDCDFDGVISSCAQLRAAQGTWITAGMRDAYLQMHALDHAHSIETWHGDRLVGGLYGIAIGRVFFGESMFSTETDASKVALTALMQELAGRSFGLLDCQLQTPHLNSLGSRLMARGDFVRRVSDLAGIPDQTGDWKSGRRPTGELIAQPGSLARLHGTAT